MLILAFVLKHCEYNISLKNKLRKDAQSFYEIPYESLPEARNNFKRALLEHHIFGTQNYK